MHHAIFLARCKEINEDGIFGELSEIALNGRYDAITTSYNEVKARHMVVAETVQEEDARQEAAVWLIPIEKIYVDVITKIKERIHEIRDTRDPPGEIQRTMPSSFFRVETMRPPEVGEFDGSPAAWPAFRDLFRAEVHEREISDVTKLLYLQKACVGKARSALGAWKPVADNYNAAWRTLVRKYDDNYRIKQALIDELFKLPRFSEETFDNLRRIIDTTSSALRQLETMGELVDHWDMLLINILAARIPLNTLDAWEQKRTIDSEPTLNHFLEFLEGKARGKISSANSYRERERKRENRGSQIEKGQRSETITSNPRARDARSPSTRPACKQCQEDHALYRCPTLLAKTVEQRIGFLRENKLCINCLRAHQGECFYSGCPRCNFEKHNSIVCKKAPSGPSIRSKVNMVSRKRPHESHNDAE